MRRLHATLAAEWYLGNADGCGSFSNNNRLYLPPDGPAVLTPWDMGSAFPEEGRDEALWDEPAGNLAALCFADADCLREQEARRAGLEETVREAGLAEGAAAVRTRIRTAAERDPWGACDPDAVQSAQARVLEWFDG